MRHAFALLIVALASSLPAAAQDAPTVLGDDLRACNVLVPGMPADLLATRVLKDIQCFHDDQGFVAAYSTYPLDDNSPLHVIAGDPVAGRWTHAALPSPPRRALEAELGHGQLRPIERLGGLILVSARVSIDGITVLLLSPDLKRVGATYGTVHAVLPNGLVVYRHAQPHFGPKHFVQLAVLDTRSGKERDVFPERPFSRVRKIAIQLSAGRYKQLGGDDWCRVNNDPCDPEQFDTDLGFATKATFNARSNAIAFPLAYSEPDITVIVTCDGMRSLNTVACRETALSDWQKLFPGQTDDQLVAHAAAEPRRVDWR